MASTRRPPSRKTIEEATTALRRLIKAVESGELDVSTPRDIALLRRLQGVLVGWEAALGETPQDSDHAT